MTNLQQELDRLTKSLGRLADDHHMKLVRKFAGAVKVNDHLIYEVQEVEGPEDDRKIVKRTRCGRVVATGGEQGSGPRPGQNWIAVEGSDRILKYGDSREDYVIVLEQDPQGIPEGRLTAVEGTG